MQNVAKNVLYDNNVIIDVKNSTSKEEKENIMAQQEHKRMRFGSVAMFALEAIRKDEALLNARSYKESEELSEYKHLHKVMDRTMDLALIFAKEVYKKNVDVDKNYLHLITIAEAQKLLANKGDKMEQETVDIRFNGEGYEISGDLVRNSKENQKFLKQKGGTWEKELGKWVVPDFLEKVDKEAEDKQKIVFGILLNKRKNEQIFEEAKTHFYNAKASNNKELIEGREFAYNMANILKNEYISIEDRKQYMLDKAKDNPEDAEKAMKFLEKLENDLKLMEEVGLVQKGTTQQGKEYYKIANLQQSQKLQDFLEFQNNLNYVKKDVMVVKLKEDRGSKQEAQATTKEKSNTKRKRNY